MAKMDEARFESCIGDSPEEIQKCMNCPLNECIDCLRFEHEAFKDVSDSFEIIKERRKRIKNLSKAELDVLRYYPYAKTDADLASLTRRSPSTVSNARKKLGLPVIKWTNSDMRRRLSALWLENEVRT